MTRIRNIARTRQRIIGIVVIVALAIIFLPTLWQTIARPQLKFSTIPTAPKRPQIKTFDDISTVKLQRLNAPQTHAWSLSLAAFTKLTNAQSLLKHLRDSGYAAYMLQQQTQQGEFYKVYVGPQIKQEKLQIEAEAIQKKWQLQGKIVPFTAIPTTKINEG